jgi:hypothetical protein
MAKELPAAIIVFLLLTFSISRASDRDSLNLKGSVRSVVTESSAYSRQGGQWIEGPRHLDGCVAFTPHGEVVQNIVFEPGGGRKFFAFKDGKMTGVLTYNADGTLESREVYALNEKDTAQTRVRYNASGAITEKEIPIYNQYGQPVEIDTYDEHGAVMQKTVNSYSEDGRLIEVNMLKGDGSRVLREVSATDTTDLVRGGPSKTENADGSVTVTGARTKKPDGFEIQMTTYNPDGSLKGKLVTFHEPKGEIIESASYGPDGSLVSKNRTAKEYDSHGNVIKRTFLRWVTSGGQAHFEPTHVLYTTLTYY